MKSIKTTLPVLSGKFPAMARTFSLMAFLLDGAPACFLELPPRVLLTAFIEIANDKGSADETRGTAREISMYLNDSGIVRFVDDVQFSVGVWGAMVARATQVYRGISSEEVRTPHDKLRVDTTCEELVAFIGRASAELTMLVHQTEARRKIGRERYLTDLRALAITNQETKRVAPPPSPQLGLFPAMAVAEATS